MNLAHIEIGEQQYRANLERPVSLAIPLQFNGAQPAFFDAPPARATPFKVTGFVGDTQQGSSCNVSSLQLTPHCNGTHTECIAHIVDDRIAVSDCVRGSLLPATLASCTPRHSVIDSSLVRICLQQHPLTAMHTAFILRTLPNTRDKLDRDYGTTTAPYFAADAVALLVAAGVEHLLVDLPSLDPRHDDGRLAAHRVFWGLPADSRSLADAGHPQGTITEMIYAPDDVQDGYYLLDLQIPAFVSDAAPSRPVIYSLEAA